MAVVIFLAKALSNAKDKVLVHVVLRKKNSEYKGLISQSSSESDGQDQWCSGDRNLRD